MPCYDQGEGHKYADPLVIREGFTGFVELAICSDGGCGHDAACPRCLHMKHYMNHAEWLVRYQGKQ